MPRFSFRRLAFILPLALALPAAGIIAAGNAAARAGDQPRPGSCLDVQRLNPHAHDGIYVLYRNGYLFTVFCYDMSGIPREYINLVVTGMDVNFSQYTAGGASPGTDVRTHFTRLRINPATLTVDIGDLTFATTTGSLDHGGKTLVTGMPYGVAMSCTRARTAGGMANIDLRGTPFRVDAAFAVGGHEATGSATVSSGRQVVSLSGGGDCGWITPSSSIHDPFNPSPGEYDLKLTCAPLPPPPSRNEICEHVG